MKRGYVITSGWAYMTNTGGTSSALTDAKRFADYDSAIMALVNSGLDMFYWDVKAV